MVELEELEEYIEYSVRVRAYTSVGPGPFSVAMVSRTLEDCEWYNVCVCVKYECIQYFHILYFL